LNSASVIQFILTQKNAKSAEKKQVIQPVSLISEIKKALENALNLLIWRYQKIKLSGYLLILLRIIWHKRRQNNNLSILKAKNHQIKSNVLKKKLILRKPKLTKVLTNPSIPWTKKEYIPSGTGMQKDVPT
jgi:hypothetical protein